MQMYKAKHRTKHRDPNRRVRKRTEEAEEVCNPLGRTTISTNQTPPKFLRTKPPTKEDTWGYPWLQLDM